jgi:cardiolipin synthase
VLHDQHAWAVGLFAYAGVTDMLDGWIARKWDQKTVVGTVIDPMADKMLMTVLTVCLAIKGALPGKVYPYNIPSTLVHARFLTNLPTSLGRRYHPWS